MKDIISTLKVLEVIGIREIYLEKREEVSLAKTNTKEESLKKLFDSYRDCTKCALHKSRTQVVFGDGNPNSPIVFVGEAPGEEEDKQGKPFVGRAGQYLNRKIEEVLGLKREDVYITNVCKCRPPENRKPLPQEMGSCFPYLRRELEIVKPKVICCLGSTAVEGILGKKVSVTKVRGKITTYPYDTKIKVLITYHPAFILRNPKADPQFVEDLKKLKSLAGL